MKPLLRCVIGILNRLFYADDSTPQDMSWEPPSEETLPQWQVRAERGDSYAMYMLGYYHSYIEEYPDKAKAFEWYLKSAEKGCVAAEYAVGCMYLDGSGVERNTKEGIKWMKLAARHRNPEAVYVMGWAYITGKDGVKKNPKEGIRLLKLAAGMDNREAFYSLGMLYYEACDWETADAAYKQRVLRFVTNSANQGYDAAQCFLTGLYFTDGDEAIPQDMKKAYYWMRKFVKQDETMTFLLGEYHVLGFGCEVDIAKGIENYMFAGKPPYLSGLATLACCFLLDDVVKPDDQDMHAKMEQTIAWLKEESEDGDAITKTLLETGYEAGKTGKEDVQKIAESLQALAEQGDANAMYLLGLFEEIGVGRERNLDKAVEWMITAAKKEHAEAEVFFGTCLFSGYGTKRNIKESREFLKRAAEHGSVEGKEYYNNQCQWELYLEDLRPSLLE